MSDRLERNKKELGCLRVLTEIVKFLDVLHNSNLSGKSLKAYTSVNSKHDVSVVVDDARELNSDYFAITIEVVNARSGLVAHRLWFAVEAASVRPVYLGYSTPYFRGKPQVEDRAGTMVTEVEHICPLRLLDKEFLSDSVLDTLYDALPNIYAYVVGLFE
jgi:hypothetical protein